MNKHNRVIIIANGDTIDPEVCNHIIKKDDFIIAVDGGLKHIEKIGIKPDLIIGDLDSVDNNMLKKYKDKGVLVETFPKEKDYTDTELALLKARDISSSVILLGAFGNRLDHTIANIYLLYEAKNMSIEMEIIGKYHRIFLLKDKAKREIPGEVGSIVSIIPMLPSVGITTYGLKYPLYGESIEFGHARGISNVKTENKAWISLEKGALIIFIVKKEVEK